MRNDISLNISVWKATFHTDTPPFEAKVMKPYIAILLLTLSSLCLGKPTEPPKPAKSGSAPSASATKKAKSGNATCKSGCDARKTDCVSKAKKGLHDPRGCYSVYSSCTQTCNRKQ